MFWIAIAIIIVLLGVVAYQLQCVIDNQKIMMKIIAESAKHFDRKIQSDAEDRRTDC